MQLELGKLLPFTFDISRVRCERAGMRCGVIARVQKSSLRISYYQRTVLCGAPAK